MNYLYLYTGWAAGESTQVYIYLCLRCGAAVAQLEDSTIDSQKLHDSWHDRIGIGNYLIG